MKKIFHSLYDCNSLPSQTSDQDELVNKKINYFLQKMVNPDRKNWSLRLNDTLWAYRTTFKIILGMSPYKPVYEKPYHLSVELEHRAYCAIKTMNFDLEVTKVSRRLQIYELKELRNEAYDNVKIYKA